MDTVTESVLLGLFAVAGALELVLLVGRRLGKRWATISMVAGRRSPQLNVIPYGWGLLGGHGLWVWPRLSSPWFSGWPVWVAVLSGVLVADIALWRQDEEDRARWPRWARILRNPGLWLLLGVALGHLTWPQRGG